MSHLDTKVVLSFFGGAVNILEKTHKFMLIKVLSLDDLRT